jgi:regulator of PEP synthase PpsR (kinase-PPPase family)
VDDTKKIVIISDGTGRTAKRLMDAVLAQYAGKRVKFSVESVFQQVRTKKRIDEVIKEISAEYLVISSLIAEEQRNYLSTALADRHILHLDVLEPMLNTMSKFLGVHPDYRPGLLQIVDDKYYNKVDAIGYTVEHDDGRGYRLEEAEVVLVGLSRTCKTPIAMYLSCNHGLKVANFPVIPEDAMRKLLIQRLQNVDPARIIGLIMKPDALARVREERAYLLSDERFGDKPLEAYHDEKEVQREVTFSLRLFEEMEWKTIDVTRRAIEEISREILRHLRKLDKLA